MTELERLQSELAGGTTAGQQVIQRQNEDVGAAPGDLSPGARETGERMLTDVMPIQRQIAREMNRRSIREEASAYPDTSYYLSKSFWKFGGTVHEVMQSQSDDPYIKDIQALNDEVTMLAMMRASKQLQNVKIDENSGEVPEQYIKGTKGLKAWHRLQEALTPLHEAAKRADVDVTKAFGYRKTDGTIKALATSNTGAGAEWIPTEYSADLIQEVRLATLVAGLFRTIPMGTAPTMILPTTTGRPTAYIVEEATTDEPGSLRSSDFTTGQITLTPRTFGVRVNLSYEFVEDSIIAVLPLVREKIVLGLADGIENAVINGDTAASHIDTGLAAHFAANPDDVRKAAWSGLRKLAGAAAQIDANTGTEAFTTVNHRNVRKAMGRYGMRPEDLVWIVSMAGYLRMLSLAEVITQDVFGSRATIFSGTMGSFDGSNIVVSEFVRSDLNATGIYDGTTLTKTQSLLVHRPSFVFGEKRAVTVEMENRPSQQRNIMIATLRRDFKGVRPTADLPCGYLFDFAS